MGRRKDLIGGGLIRSHGGWAAVRKLRAAKAYQKGDERILGDGDFVECYWVSCELGLSQVWLARRLGISQPAVSSAVERGRKVAEEKNYTLVDR